MASERDDRLAQAERLIRRGDLAEAALGLRQLRDLYPDDAQVASRLAAVTALADPRAAARAEPPRAAAPPAAAPPPPPTPEELAEQQIVLGDLASGIAIYERILAKLPEHPRAKQRLAELRPAAPLPSDPVDLLEMLLQRVQSQRRR